MLPEHVQTRSAQVQGDINYLCSKGMFLCLTCFPEPQKSTEEPYKISGTEGQILVSKHQVQQLFHGDSLEFHGCYRKDLGLLYIPCHIWWTMLGRREACCNIEANATLLLLHPLQQWMQNLHPRCTNRNSGHTLGSPLGLPANPVVNGSFSNKKD